MTKPRGLNIHIYPSPLTHETRMEKIARAISRLEVFDGVELLGISAPGLPVHEQRAGFTLRRFGRMSMRGPRLLRKALATLDWSRRVYVSLRDCRVACINCHSLAVLPLAVALKFRHGSRLIYDTHELETEVSTSIGLTRWLYRGLEWLFIPYTDAVVVVSDSIADWYAKAYGIARPVVVRNVPELVGLPPARNRELWRNRFGIPAEHLIFIYQGGLFRGRRVEQFLRVFAQVKPDRHIVFMGYGDLQADIELAVARRPNIHFAPAVAPADVLRHTAGADVGLVGVENICLSYYYSLPNKVLEYLLAGVPALMPSYPEMVRFTRCRGAGWIVGEADADWLEAINRLTPSQVASGYQTAVVGRETLSWKTEATHLEQLYVRTAGTRTSILFV